MIFLESLQSSLFSKRFGWYLFFYSFIKTVFQEFLALFIRSSILLSSQIFLRILMLGFGSWRQHLAMGPSRRWCVSVNIYVLVFCDDMFVCV